MASLLLSPPLIISGGQTGVDRAALQVAKEFGFQSAGWCPKGRRSESGPIPNDFFLLETSSENYEERTQKNVSDSCATLALTFGRPTTGTAFTIQAAVKSHKPLLVLNLDSLSVESALKECRQWLKFWEPRILNFAGPRQSKQKDVEERARRFFRILFSIFTIPESGLSVPKWPPNEQGIAPIAQSQPERLQWPFFEEDEISAVVRVMRSGKVNYWTGSEGKLFEREFAQFIGTNYAVALANGSVALEAALMALGIGPGDEVIVPCRSFIASASSVIMRGATPVFADIDPDSQNLTAGTIKPKISGNTKAIILVHLAGWPCDVAPIAKLVHGKGIRIIEDCAQSLGASYFGKSTGSLGDVAAFSFCQDKIMTTGGEGGMITTNSFEIWEKIWSYKDHGRNFDAVFHQKHREGFQWLCSSIGTNWRMTEMQAAIGRVALRKVPGWVATRRKNAHFLLKNLANPDLRIPLPPKGFQHAYYKFYLFLDNPNFKSNWNRNRMIETLNSNGVYCINGSCSEIYREEAFLKAAIGPSKRLKWGAKLGETSLMFQIHPTLPKKELEKTVEVILKILGEACR